MSSNEDRVRCPVPRRLFADWTSRGLVHDLGDRLRYWEQMHKGYRVMVETDKTTLASLRDDALWHCDPSMGQDASWRRTCRLFIKAANEVLEVDR